MATHKTTLWSERALDHAAQVRDVADRLLVPEMSERDRFRLGMDLGRIVLGLGQLSESIRTGQRPPSAAERGEDEEAA